MNFDKKLKILTKIIQKVNKLVRKLDQNGELKPETRFYDQLMQ